MSSEQKNNNEKKFLGMFKKKEPKGITKEDAEKEKNAPRNVAFFFKLLKRNFSKLLTLNFFMIFMVIPIVIAIYVYIQGPTTPSHLSTLSPTLFGAELISNSPAVSLMQNVFGSTIQLPVYGSFVYYIIAALLVVLAIFWGWLNVGSTYVLRSMVRGEPIFMWSDFFYAIKRNLKQGFFMGLLDFIIMAVLAFDLVFFSGNSGNFSQDVMFFCTIGLAVIYCFMRFYIYIMLITFDLSISKLLKNALIFTAIGIKRNFMAALGIIILAVINLMLVILLMPIGIIVPVILPFVYFLPLSSFIATYAAYPNIKKYMIDPQTPAQE